MIYGHERVDLQILLYLRVMKLVVEPLDQIV